MNTLTKEQIEAWRKKISDKIFYDFPDEGEADIRKRLTDEFSALCDMALRSEAKPVASSSCPMCGQDTPHAHGERQVVEWLRVQARRFYPDGDIQVCGHSSVGFIFARYVEDALGRHYLIGRMPPLYHTTDSDNAELSIQHDPELYALLNNGRLDKKSMRITPLYAGNASPTPQPAQDVGELVKALRDEADWQDQHFNRAGTSGMLRKAASALSARSVKPEIVKMARSWAKDDEYQQVADMANELLRLAGGERG